MANPVNDITNPLKRLYAGDPWRKTRLHDMRGNFAGVRALATDLPRSLAGVTRRRFADRYPPLPWVPYPVIRELQSLVKPNWRVLEHGSGMSTIWWSERVASVKSIEANEEWADRVQDELDRRGAKNVSLELRTGAGYTSLADFADHSFDVVVIDGHAREKVAMDAPRILKRPGLIYLDNTDFAAQWHENYGEAEEILLDLAALEHAEVTHFTGFPPATFVATQGMLIKFGEH